MKNAKKKIKKIKYKSETQKKCRTMVQKMRKIKTTKK